MRKQKFSVKLITLLMACLVTMTSVPVHIVSSEADDGQSIAADASTDNTNIDIDNQSGIGEYTDTDVFIVEEDVSKRGEFEKHYLCSDGTYISVSYAEAIHYLDDNNTWKDVDQSLVLDTKTGTYKNGESDFEVCFSEKASSSDMVSISKGEHTLSWGLATKEKLTLETQANAGEFTQVASVDNVSDKAIISPSSAKIKSKPALSYSKASERLISSEDSFVLPNASSQITYDDIILGDQNISVQYTVFQNKIEEDIIIYNRSDIDYVSMNMDIGELTPVVNSDKSIDFVDDENIMQFHIDIPYMIDADMNVCNDIEVIAQKNGNSCTITYIPNKEWFDSEERVFPIVLDPAVTTNDYASSIEDTYVEENSTAIHTSEQYLHISDNGDNRRKAFIRIKRLPMVDESMPIISGKLELTSIYGPLVDVYLQASYHNWGFELNELTFEVLDNMDYVYTCTNCQFAGNDRVVFDISNYIYQIYSDEQYFLEYDLWDGADFTIEYASENSSSVYPFYSSEYTDKAYRPTLTVRYGYSIPAGMLDGEVYSFQNAKSGSFMSVLSENLKASTNVFQKALESDASGDGYDISVQQQFKLEYVPSTGGYLLRPMASANGNGLVVEVYNSANNFAAGGNVQLYGRDTARMQEWLIVPYDNEYFRIIPRTQMSLALMTKGYVDGNNVTTGVVDGNVFVKELEDDNYSQIWFIYDENGDEVITTEYRSDIESGNYYITNFYSGRYLHSTGGTVNCISGKISALGNSTVKWKIVNLGDGYCTIQHATIPGRYLAPASNSGGSTVRLMSSSSDTIPDTYKWMLVISQGDIMIRHKITGYYLYGATQDSNPSNVSMRPQYTKGSPDYNRQKWCFVKEENFVELNDVTFRNMELEKTESATPTMTRAPYRTTWSNVKDFEYTIISGSQYITYNATTHKFTGVAPGTAEVRAVHKSTGITKTFDVKVNNTAIIIIPGIMGTELARRSYTDQGIIYTSVWSDELSDVSFDEKIYALSLLMCNQNGESIEDIVPVNNLYGANNAYMDLYNMLTTNYSEKYQIEFYAYDWRLSNAISSEKLDDFIEEKNYDKVYLIAHSMGGLVSSGYLALGQNQRNKVKGIIMLGSPLLGTPGVPYLLGSGDVTEVGMDEIIGLPDWAVTLLISVSMFGHPLSLLTNSFSSVYDAFPSEKYFDINYAGKTYLNVEFQELPETECVTYDLSRQYCEAFLAWFNPILADASEDFHNSLYINGRHVTEIVNTYYIAGYGFNTVDRIYANGTLWMNDSTEENIGKGDSLVPVWSATLGDRQPNRTIYAKDISHMELISNEDCLNCIVNLINGHTTLPVDSALSQDMVWDD